MTNDLSQGMMSRRTLLMGAAMSSAWQAFAKETPETAAAADATTGQGKLEDLRLFQTPAMDQHQRCGRDR